MRVKFIAPGILPGDYVTAELQALPRKGDTVLAYTTPDEQGQEPGECPLVVSAVIHPLHIPWAVDHHADADMPEVICDRTEDAPEPEPGCTCHATSLGKPHHYPWCQMETQQPERISNGN